MTTALVLASNLPGGDALDADFLASAVREINRLHAAKGLETARAVGSFVLETFFGNDTENFRAHGKKHVTFRELGEREDLQVSYSFIWNAVSVVDQLRLLPADIASVLPLSHHKLLLPVKDPEKKVKLATEAVEKGLGKRELEAKVKKVRAKETVGEKRGRKPDPELLKALRHATSAVEELNLKRFTPGRMEDLGKDALAMRLAVEKAYVKLGEVRKLLASTAYTEGPGTSAGHALED